MRDQLQRGRRSYRQRAWDDAYRSLSRADEADPLDVDDLERLAVAAYLVGRDEKFLKTLERAHHAHLDAGDDVRAARAAFWIGLRLLLRGEAGPANGWLGRAERLLEHHGEDCAERGYLAVPAAEQRLAAGELQAAHRLAAEAYETGERFADTDLVACARHLLGRILVRQGRVGEGLAMLDEAMVAVTAGELTPIMTGLIYCSVIAACRQIHALGRARDWTAALATWCEEQPEMVAFTATCRVHRAEILELQGEWRDASAEAQRVCDRFARGIGQERPGAAFYRRAELHRLRGEFAAAEEAYKRSSQWGREPQPGLALLRLAQGRTEFAVAAVQRVEAVTTDQLERIEILPALVEILLAASELEAARTACDELEAIAVGFETEVLAAMAAHARGAIELAQGDAREALRPLRRSWEIWHRLEAPYMAARLRMLIATACRELGDADGANLELEAARMVFEELGAAPDLRQADRLAGAARSDQVHGLSPRELEVLQLVATGMTNKAIAAVLSISERTVARHVSNIFDKLGLSTRAAATAYAHEHRLV